MIKVGSDFSGVGAFNQALMRLGIEYDEIFACDMDKYARETFIHNYGEPKYYPKDVYEREIPKESLDIYMTSPPCQAFSNNGKNLGKDDKRGILFYNSHEFIKRNKPKYFIIENVRGLLSDDNGNTFREWLNLLAGKSVNGLPVLFQHKNSVPYHIYYKVIIAKKHGVPQNRERVFIVGIRDDADNHFRWPKEENLEKKLIHILEKNVSKDYAIDFDKIKYLLINEGSRILDKDNKNYLFKNNDIRIRTNNIKGHEILTNQDSLTISFIKSKTRKGRIGKQISQTIDTSCNIAVIDNYAIRRLTPRECFRLMDFPDTFTWSCSDSQAYKQAGNSIVVRCLELIIKQFNL